MTSTAAASSASSSNTTRPGAARESRESRGPERREALCDERSAADFERALRQRSQLGEHGGRGSAFGDEEACPSPPDAGLTAPPALHPFALALPAVQPPVPAEAAPPARGLVEAPSATLRAQLAQSPTPAGTDAARAFEVSLKQPQGAALTLQAVAPAAGASWVLSIGAHGLNPQDLRRNLGRLEERLRARGVRHEALGLHQDTASTDAEDLP